MLGTQIKQPADYLDYDVSFEDWLPEGDAVSSATATVSPTSELAIADILVLSPLVKVWLSGGTTGSAYKITIVATTAQGRIKEAEFKIRVREM